MKIYQCGREAAQLTDIWQICMQNQLVRAANDRRSLEQF